MCNVLFACFSTLRVTNIFFWVSMMHSHRTMSRLELHKLSTLVVQTSPWKLITENEIFSFVLSTYRCVVIGCRDDEFRVDIVVDGFNSVCKMSFLAQHIVSVIYKTSERSQRNDEVVDFYISSRSDFFLFWFSMMRFKLILTVWLSSYTNSLWMHRVQLILENFILI